MTKRRFPDSPAICKYLGGNEITAAAWGTMAIAPGHSLRSGFDASASSETAEQEQREVYHKRNRQGGSGICANAATAVCRALPFKVLMPILIGLYPFFQLLKFQPSSTAFRTREKQHL